MADVRTFEEYFTNRPEVTGPELQGGDDVLVLRGGTVQRKNQVYIRGFAYMEDNASPTVINSINAYELVTGVMLSGGVSASLAFAANAFTYSGPNQTDLIPIEASMVLSSVSVGDAVTIGAGIFVNGVQIGGGVSVTAPPTIGVAASLKAAYALQTGDVIDIRLRNRKDTIDVILQDINWLVG